MPWRRAFGNANPAGRRRLLDGLEAHHSAVLDLTLSEVLGHTDLLLNDGRVHEVMDGETVRFEALS